MSVIQSKEILVENTETVVLVKKKGRPRKNPLNMIEATTENIQVEKKKRGRKKKEKVEEEIKPKKKRGRKAAIKFFSSSIRKKIPLTTIIYDNDNYVLHLDIKEKTTENKITYDVLRNEYSSNNKKQYSTSINESNTRFDSDDNENENENDNDNDNDNDDNDNDNDNDDDILDDYLNKYLDTDNTEVKLSELYEKRLESRLLQDNQLIKKLGNLQNDDKLLLKLVRDTENKKNKNINKIDCKNKGYVNILSDFIDTNNWIENSNIACWWCCHTFNTIPLGLPVDYHKKKFRVKGLFCSFACTIAYGKNNNLYNTKNKSMINSLYKKLTGYTTTDTTDNYKSIIHSDCIQRELFDGDNELQNEYIDSLMSFIDTPLLPAPDKHVLKMFGGNLSIEEFRNSTKEKKIYKMIEYPMFVSRDYIEEIDINNLKNVNKNVFTRQSTPTLNKLDETKLNEVKSRINSTVTKSGMDRFIRL
jgi:hypothetical protein